MKKKVYLNGRFLTQSITGVQRTAFELVQALDKLIGEKVIDEQQFQYFLIHPGKAINNIQLNKIKVVKRGFFTGNIWEQFELPVYTSGGLLVSMCTISTLFKRKQLVFVHDASFVVNPAFFPFVFRTWYRIAITALGKIARHIITVSNFSKSELITHLGFEEQKISVIYDAADHVDSFAEPEETFKEKVDSYKPYCLAVSSLSSNKNFSGLAKAVAKANISDHRMLIAGGAVKTLQNSATQFSVNYYLGYMSNPQLKYLYTNAALFVFPSFYEGFGIPPLEAMRLGCPVVSSNTSSLPEVLGDACEYINPHDTDNMAATIEATITDKKKLLHLREKGYKRANMYSWRTSAMQLQELINKYSEQN